MADENTKTKKDEREINDEHLETVAGGGDGTTEHFFTVEIAEGRYAAPKDDKDASIRRVSPNVVDPAS